MERPEASLAEDARDVAWRFLVGAGAGGLIGLATGGIGGRLVMLILRLASEDGVIGIDSDDGFEIGRFSTSTFFLLGVAAGLGAGSGVTYIVVRSALPRRGRAALWGVFFAIVVGADTVKADGIDFTLLDPKWFAVSSFVLLPGVAAFTIAVLVERLLAIEPWSRRWLSVLLTLGALSLNIVLVLVVTLGAATLGLRRVPAFGRVVLAVAKIAVPALLLVVAVASGVELYRDALKIL